MYLLVSMDEVVPSSAVMPSGADLTRASPAIRPAAPGLLSTTTGWPKLCPMRSPSTRVMTSVAPPAAKGTITRTGRVAKLACACAQSGPAAAAPAARASSWRRLQLGRGLVIACLLCCVVAYDGFSVHGDLGRLGHALPVGGVLLPLGFELIGQRAHGNQPHVGQALVQLGRFDDDCHLRAELVHDGLGRAGRHEHARSEE